MTIWGCPHPPPSVAVAQSLPRLYHKDDTGRKKTMVPYVPKNEWMVNDGYSPKYGTFRGFQTQRSFKDFMGINGDSGEPITDCRSTDQFKGLM